MTRPVVLNYELQIDANTVYPVVVPEISPGEEGLQEVTDGNKKFKVRDGIEVYEELEFEFNQKKGGSNTEIDIMDAWVKSKAAKDVFLIGRDAGKNIVQNWLLEDCEAVHRKATGQDRKSPAPSMRKYALAPVNVDQVE